MEGPVGTPQPATPADSAVSIAPSLAQLRAPRVRVLHARLQRSDSLSQKRSMTLISSGGSTSLAERIRGSFVALRPHLSVGLPFSAEPAAFGLPVRYFSPLLNLIDARGCGTIAHRAHVLPSQPDQLRRVTRALKRKPPCRPDRRWNGFGDIETPGLDLAVMSSRYALYNPP
jgi:hypothetical protein